MGSNNISNKQDTYSEDFFVKMDRKEKEKKTNTTFEISGLDAWICCDFFFN